MKQLISGVGLLVFGLFGCTSGLLLDPEAAQGITGTIVLGPTCPVVPMPDDGSCRGRTIEFGWVTVATAAGKSVAVIRADRSGHFRIGLAPGSYVIGGAEGDPYPTAERRDVAVMANEWLEVQLHYDTGIRGPASAGQR